MEHKNLSQIHLSYDYLKQALNLPEDCEVVRLQNDPLCGSFRVVIQSPEAVKDITFPTEPGATPKAIRPPGDEQGGMRAKVKSWR